MALIWSLCLFKRKSHKTKQQRSDAIWCEKTIISRQPIFFRYFQTDVKGELRMDDGTFSKRMTVIRSEKKYSDYTTPRNVPINNPLMFALRTVLGG